MRSTGNLSSGHNGRREIAEKRLDTETRKLQKTRTTIIKIGGLCESKDEEIGRGREGMREGREGGR